MIIIATVGYMEKKKRVKRHCVLGFNLLVIWATQWPETTGGLITSYSIRLHAVCPYIAIVCILFFQKPCV
jgi:hypothetical protein